jgi:NADH-quinone oxidoreductase subunit H
LVSKEGILPEGSNPTIYISAPIVTFSVGLGGWVIIPFGEGSVISDISLGVLYLFALSSVGVYAIIMAGWSSNSKYAFLGALRSAAQMLSYEVAFGFGLLNVFISVGSLNLSNVVNIQREIVWLVCPLFPVFIMFFISLLAETSRHPFDLPEAESELVSGYNVEYSGMAFSLFFLGEYLIIINMCAFCAIIFLGGWDPFLDLSLLQLVGPFWFGIKIWFLGSVFILVRAAIPRYRYDQLIVLGWKVFVPFSIGFTVYNASIVCWSRGYYDMLEIYSSWF